MTCQHPNRTTYLYALGRRTTEMCPDCKAAAEAIGMVFRERRETDLTPMVERRHRPAWLARLTARTDESWRLAS